MAIESWDAAVAVDEQPADTESSAPLLTLRSMLEEEPFRFHFFQAVRLLEKMDSSREPVGYFVTPQNETIRFVSRPRLGFPPSELCDLNRSEAGQTVMTVEFMGLCAAISVLPAVYTEHLLERIREKDDAMAEFFNIFNHRMISFFYRGWGKYRIFVDYEKAGADRLSAHFFDLLGLGTEGLRGRAGIPDDAFLHYVGILGHCARSAASLQQILEEFFSVPAAVEQFAGAWRKLPPESYTLLSGSGGASERLGVGVVAGDEVWDHHGRIRICIGPMRLPRYLEFLPGNDAHRELVSLLRFFSNGNYEAEVRLVLAREDVPPCALGSTEDSRSKLGLVSWLKTKPLDRDPADATYLVQ